MIKVIEPVFEEEIIYSTVEDFCREILTDEIIEEWITSDFGMVYLPLEVGEFGYGFIIREVTDADTWNAIREEYTQFFIVEIEDELANTGSSEFEGYTIEEID